MSNNKKSNRPNKNVYINYKHLKIWRSVRICYWARFVEELSLKKIKLISSSSSISLSYMITQKVLVLVPIPTLPSLKIIN